MILGFPRAKQGLYYTKHGGSEGYHFVSIAHNISSLQLGCSNSALNIAKCLYNALPVHWLRSMI